MILPPKCVKHALSSLLMSQITSPDDYSQVKPLCSIEFNETIEYSDSNIDNADGIISDAVILINDISNKHVLEKLYRPEFLEMDGSQHHNIEIQLTFTYDAEPESTCNVNEYNREGLAVKTNALNHFKDLIEACAVAGGLNQGLTSHLIFHVKNAHVVN